MKLKKWDRVRHPKLGDGVVCYQMRDGWTVVAFLDEKRFYQVKTNTLQLIKVECTQ